MENFNHLEGDEKLKAENEFLKMKLMLENGAKFEMSEENELPAGVENEFLSNMAAFEKQFAEHKTIKVFDKIGRPVILNLLLRYRMKKLKKPGKNYRITWIGME